MFAQLFQVSIHIYCNYSALLVLFAILSCFFRLIYFNLCCSLQTFFKLAK